MPNPNAIVDTVEDRPPSVLDQAAAPAQRFVAVTFAGGRSALLDTADPRSSTWSNLLDALQRGREPVYVEVDPVSNVIVRLLIPLIVRVGDVSPSPDGDGQGVDVELIVSHARHTVRRTNPDFEPLVGALRAARDQGTAVLVTETVNDHEIIDVRPLPPSMAPLAPPALAEPPDLGPGPAGPAATLISLPQAQQLFNLANTQTCCPAGAAAPCIPFTYPDDGCWARAHEMCRLFIAAGVQPDKVWIYGSLRAATQNHPACQVRWGWHVAPTVLVNTAAGAQTYVIDPSLFTGPVPRATWAGVQGDPAATLVPSSAAVFHRRYDGTVSYDDAAYTRTRHDLDTYRRQLIIRATGSDGPPPYVACLTRPPGVQWIGTIGGGATARWFTFGWPAAWHVLWTIMPLTACPGRPQLSWAVQVERANTTQATYWITVRNLTSSAVRFEGRYDVLSR